jgi:hypothetical protein
MLFFEGCGNAGGCYSTVLHRLAGLSRRLDSEAPWLVGRVPSKDDDEYDLSELTGEAE